MIYITSDTHGDQYKWIKQVEPILKSGDVLIIAGDFGIGFWDDIYLPEEMFFDFLADHDEILFLFVDGNHEDFERLNNYPVETWRGGKVHRIRDNILHLMRGELFDIEGHSIFVMGGGCSLDKYRREEGISWWPQEMPSEEEYNNALTSLKRVNLKVDYVITHTAPSVTANYLLTSGFGIECIASDEYELTSFLDYVHRNVEYLHWFFGHFHVDAELLENQTAIFDSIRELVSGKIVRKW